MREYLQTIKASVNCKGVFDVDVVKGCTLGMAAYPKGGCYGLCYAAKLASFYGYDFTKSVRRRISCKTFNQLTFLKVPQFDGPKAVVRALKSHRLDWFRIGTMGDPCHDWQLVADVCEWLSPLKRPVVVTKHWREMPCEIIERLAESCAIVNTSVSALDTYSERKNRTSQHERMKKAGLKAVLRVVTCKFGDTERGRVFDKIQKELLSANCVIDNPLRIPKTDERVLRGDILVSKRKDLKAKVSISVNNECAYIGHCNECPDQCGVNVKEVGK